ncbi:hypothetical protein AXF42_Ash021529 [Apostasia shenzhenica]|uniref:Uncharacterized protein n=1 Tax=Apostasia shenzhenica TaxID=1088818 RepID=A0A2H9ZVN5_9ASPA|nr:hypothetical protein AXF42_Ash021529 [Apostasia shenzhenica]
MFLERKLNELLKMRNLYGKQQQEQVAMLPDKEADADNSSFALSSCRAGIPLGLFHQSGNQCHKPHLRRLRFRRFCRPWVLNHQPFEILTDDILTVFFNGEGHADHCFFLLVEVAAIIAVPIFVATAFGGNHLAHLLTSWSIPPVAAISAASSTPQNISAF